MMIFLGVLAGVAAGAVARWFIGVPPFWAVVVALPVAACAFLALLLVGVAAPGWQPLPVPDESLAFHAATSLSSRFAEAAKDQKRFHARVQPRLRKLRHDITREELGDELYDLLTKGDATLPPPRRLAELLGRLEGK
jgi:hypothetical protein